MLINAQRAEQVRVAVVDGSDLKDYQVEITDRNLCRGNIYRGIVANLQPSLNAGFIDIGEDRHGFLSVADVLPSLYHKKPPKDVRRPRIDQVLERNKPILVQATKDGTGLKGAALSTNVSLAGRYLVLTPYDSTRGISRKAEDDKSRKIIRQRLSKLELPDGHGVIVRTNGLEQNQQTLNRDLNALLRMWKRVQEESAKGKGPRLLYSDQDLIVQALRDYLDSSIAQVIVDEDSVYEKAATYMRAFMPRSKTKLIRYDERLPLFTRYRIEPLIDRIHERKAPLPSGGSIVIDATEALTAIDVNSGRATKGSSHDESILAVNIEAANEIARQLRLRDIGGLVVVDFIDMRTRKHQNKLEKVMRDAMKVDKARYSVGRISPNGLLEINRQRIKQALHQRTQRSCPTCFGAGSIPNAEFAATAVLGRIEARIAAGLVERVTVAVHPEIADALQNHNRARLVELEQQLELKIEVISAPNFSHTEERIDYQQRETAVAPRPAPALSSSDLATVSAGLPEEQRDAAPDPEIEEEGSEKKKTRRRRRRRKGDATPPIKAKAKAKAKAEAAPQTENRTEPSAEPPGDQATEQAAGNGKPPRRRRRRGGRRNRRSSTANGDLAAPAKADNGDPSAAEAAAGEAAAGEAAAGDAAAGAAAGDAVAGETSFGQVSPARPDNANRWNLGIQNEAPTAAAETTTAAETAAAAETTTSAETAGALGDQEVAPKPRRRRRRPRRSSLFGKPIGQSSPSPSEDARPPSPSEDAQPAHDDAWRSPMLDEKSDSATPSGDRSPPRRERTSLRWQWWGGGKDEADSGGGDS